MVQYIDKSALVAWLKERIRDYWSDSENTMGIFPYALEEVIKYVDTLEAKEVDLEKEIEEHAINMPISEFVNDGEVEDYYEWAREEFKYFFELGIKAREGGEK